MLTDAKVKTLKPKDKLYRILDTQRLYIEVRPTGTKIWRYKFVLNGKEGTVSFGEYPAVSLQDARKLRDEAQAKLAKGLNPSQEKKKEKIQKKIVANNTFKAIAEEYVEEKMKYKSEDYVKRFNDCMQRDIYNEIGNMPIKDVTSAHILNIMRNTQSRVQNSPIYGTGEAAANLNRRFIGLVMRYAIITLRAEIDPTYALKNAIEMPDVEHARPLTKQEKSNLRKKLDVYGGTTTVRNAGLMLLYSMLRTVEVRKMEWDFVDFNDLTITFPKSSRRTGQERVMKKNRVHIVPITTQIHSLLIQQQQITGDQKYVFSSPQKRDCMLSRTTLNKMLEYIGLSEVTSHDFRATASTDLNSLNYESDWIEAQLAHADDNKTRASYNHAKYLSDRRKMMQDWANIVDSWKDLK
ncbi:integrase arm-type DNA-binding domain-containing protein [uncultured Acinetobacter sp.]|uniref:tyrosine-type recombinase/integrase n=1 Tax=uncultured Acinetobacter sp. TaxID=165433 RepID=UPI0025D13A35|nr:integrase arm-type DNA-binding domain-containing protein [uncultured Acinetobacter sp.]